MPLNRGLEAYPYSRGMQQFKNEDAFFNWNNLLDIVKQNKTKKSRCKPIVYYHLCKTDVGFYLQTYCMCIIYLTYTYTHIQTEHLCKDIHCKEMSVKKTGTKGRPFSLYTFLFLNYIPSN